MYYSIRCRLRQVFILPLLNTIGKRRSKYERYTKRTEPSNGQSQALQPFTSFDEWCAQYDNDLWMGSNHKHHTMAMARIKRVKRTEDCDGQWQLDQLREGWYTADFDFDTDEYIMKRCEDIKTISVQQARLLSYSDPNTLTERQRQILWPDE